MPIFKRKPKPPPVLNAPLPPDEKVERSTRASLLYGGQEMNGALHMTNYRLMFEADKGDARWMIVPFKEVKSAGLYAFAGGPGRPPGRNQCLVIETTRGEQVWWDFGEKEEREWLTVIQEHARAERPADEPPPDTGNL